MSSTITQTVPIATEEKLTLAFNTEAHKGYEYSQYLPVYDNETKFPPLESFEFVDRGLSADKAKANLLQDPTAQVTELTPRVGTEIRGLQLSKLTDTQKNELALLIAERGVVVFRDQDFKEIGPVKQKEFGAYFGPLHVHVRSFYDTYREADIDKTTASWSPRQRSH
jgi:sulfonate dioxygenase